MEWSLLALPGLVLWLLILILPWRPWSTREAIDASAPGDKFDAGKVTVLIPARNEQAVIAETLQGLKSQSPELRIILVDDQSHDETSQVALRQDLPNLQVIRGQPLPAGWSGKLWALDQALQNVDTELVLLLDADIKLQPGTLAVLLKKLQDEDLAMISLMAHLRMKTAWEKILLPAFIFFFKLLYPFRLSNSSSRLVAAAAGGCILTRTAVLKNIQAFESLRGNLIDDCALARKIKANGGKIWLGLTHSAISLRPYKNPGEIWDMVARTAFTQLYYSWILLILCSVIMIFAFFMPVLAVLNGHLWATISGLGTLVIMYLCYWPVIHYYDLKPVWLLALPIAGILFLLMTWSSAWRHAIKAGAHWKNRHYSMTALK